MNNLQRRFSEAASASEAETRTGRAFHNEQECSDHPLICLLLISCLDNSETPQDPEGHLQMARLCVINGTNWEYIQTHRTIKSSKRGFVKLVCHSLFDN